MNREILFRGKRVDSDEWTEGYLVRGEHYIYETEITAIYPPDTIFYPNTETTGYDRVFPETIGQYTGLTDKNGKKIFEGDILRDCDGRIYEIKHFDFEWIAEQTREFWINIKHLKPCEIIGNVFDYKLEDFR